MLARAPHVAFTTFACLFGCLGFVPIAALRAALGPAGLVINLGYAFTIVGAQFYWGLGRLWAKACAFPAHAHAQNASPLSHSP